MIAIQGFAGGQHSFYVTKSFCQAGGGSERRFVLIGGFLGVGMTTLIGHFARWLAGRGQRVGLVTNDQGQGLIDTATVRLAVGSGEDGRVQGGVVEIAGEAGCGLRVPEAA